MSFINYFTDWGELIEEKSFKKLWAHVNFRAATVPNTRLRILPEYSISPLKFEVVQSSRISGTVIISFSIDFAW
jgi:hypothetical protein